MTTNLNPKFKIQNLKSFAIGRRAFLGASSQGVGLAALGSLVAADRVRAADTRPAPGLPSLPHIQAIADDICIIKSMYTEAINHDPAITFMNTGNQQPGYASMGSWISYGLGSENENLPAFIAMVSQGSGKNPGQPIFSRLWGNGFLPSSHQGVGLRPGANPVLYLANPPGTNREQRRAFLDDLAELNRQRAAELGDPETLARIESYEMAFRMQTSVPELTDLSGES